jgi:hypothetical protein
MSIKISSASDSFKEIVTEFDSFVDKSLFIKEIIDTGAVAILIMRPRGWGKTVNLDMLKTFFEPGAANHAIFAGGKFILQSGEEKTLSALQISNVYDGEYMRYQGKYPVIFLSLKDVTGDSVEVVESRLRLEISKVFSKYDYLFTSRSNEQKTKLSYNIDLKKFNELIQGTSTLLEVLDSLYFLSELLYKYHKQNVYIIIDEYDKPINYLLEKGLTYNVGDRDKISEHISSIMSRCGKGNKYLEKIIFAGVFDAIQKSMFSGFNNYIGHGIEDISFSKSFGFNQEEVKRLVNKLGLEKEISDQVNTNLKSWYGGYIMPMSSDKKLEIYAPGSVLNYLNLAYEKHDYSPKSYWMQSGSGKILQVLLKDEACMNTALTNKLFSIVSAGGAELKFNGITSLFRYDLAMGPVDERIFSYLLLNSGYLTVNITGLKSEFSIPNLEVRKGIAEVVRSHIQDIHKDGICAKILYELDPEGGNHQDADISDNNPRIVEVSDTMSQELGVYTACTIGVMLVGACMLNYYNQNYAIDRLGE